MIWLNFPVGMSFSVKDFSDETKRKCWMIALAALATTEVKNRQGMTLYDNCAEHLPGSAEKEYVCIMNHMSVVQSRVNVPLWRKMSRLTAYLSLHYPFYQANALDGFGPYSVLGTIRDDGTLSVEEAGKSILPEKLPTAMPADLGERILIALPATPDPCGFANVLKEIGKAASAAGMQVCYCPLAEGREGTCYAFTFAEKGRFEWIKFDKNNPSVLIGIMPGETVITDLSALKALQDYPEGSSEPLGKLITSIWNLGYRNIMLSIENYKDADHGNGMLNALSDTSGNLDPRIKESRFILLTGITEQQAFQGALGELVHLGAEIQNAQSLLSEKMLLEKQIMKTDILVISERYAKSISHTHQKMYTVSDRELREPELLYGIFLHKFTRAERKQ